MVHKTKAACGKEIYFGYGEDNVAIADDEIEKIVNYKNNDRFTRVMEKFASTRIGQMMMEKTDRVLKVVETTAKWSLPQDDSDIQLERPLPWILFIILIVLLRMVRIWLSVGAFIVGLQPVTARPFFCYIQTKRRRLRAMRLQGLKTISKQELGRTIMSTSSNNNVTFMGKLRKFFGSAICKLGQQREVPARRLFGQVGESVMSSIEPSGERSSKRPRDDNDAAGVHNLTVSEMLDKFANEDSDSDSDYIPEEEDEEESDDNSTSHTSSVIDEEAEGEDQEASSEAQKDTNKSEEIKENGETRHQPEPQPLKKTKTDIPKPVYNFSEQLHTPKEMPDANGAAEVDQTYTTPEVAPQSTLKNTPKTSLSHLAAPHVKENVKKSTPGHESAASLKSFPPKAVKTAQTSTPNESDHYESSISETPDSIAAGSKKKHFNHPSHNKNLYYHYGKNRTNNRR